MNLNLINMVVSLLSKPRRARPSLVDTKLAQKLDEATVQKLLIVLQRARHPFKLHQQLYSPIYEDHGSLSPDSK